MKKIGLFFLLALVVFYAAPAPVMASGFDTINLAAGLVPCEDGTKCTACHLIQLANNVINWLISILMVVFAILIMWAGFKLVTSGGNTSAKQDAKNTFTNAIIGLIIVLAAWILVDTMLRALLGNNGDIAGYGPWSSISCAGWQQATPTLLKFEEDQFVASGGEETGVVSSGGGANCPAASPAEVSSLPSSMVKGGSGKVRSDLVSKIVAMRDAAAQNGITIKVSSGWRSEQMQVSLWNKYCSSGSCGATKVAKPCSLGGNGSNHNSGTAIDISVGCTNGSSGCNTPTYNWLKANGGNFGFYNNLPTDPVHWSLTGR